MERNPFNDLLSIMDNRSKEVSETSFFIGKITGGLPNLKVVVEGLELDKSSLLINKGVVISNGANISCSTGTITHNMKDSLSVGDSVVLLRMNDKFVVLCKVVSL